MTNEELLQIYKEEIETGEVGTEELIKLNSLLKLDWVEDFTDVQKGLSETHNLYLYFKKHIIYPCHHLGALYEFEVRPAEIHDGNIGICEKFKNTIKMFLYTNAFKKINF